jgi:hypothetical protein
MATSKKNGSKMCQMVLTMKRMGRKIIEVGIHDMFNVMESIRHGPLESSPNIFKAKRKFAVSKGSPWKMKEVLCWSVGSILIWL